MPLTDAEALQRVKDEYETPGDHEFERVTTEPYALLQPILCYPYPPLDLGAEIVRMIKLEDLELEEGHNCIFHHGIVPNSDPSKVVWDVETVAVVV